MAEKSLNHTHHDNAVTRLVESLTSGQRSELIVLLTYAGTTNALRRALGAAQPTLAPSQYPSVLETMLRERGWPESAIVRAVEIEGGVL